MTAGPGSYDRQSWILEGIQAPFVNALRRVILSEIPTMAIHQVLFYQNTSVMPD